MTDFRDDPRLTRSVYQPAEDSALLAEVATDVVSPGDRVLETGVGSGYVSMAVMDAVDVDILGTDINPHACQQSADRGLAVVRMSLVDGIADESIDVALFNPPYLPADDRIPDDWLGRAVDGGPTGGELTMAWLADVGRVLRTGGIALCIVSTHTGIDRIRQAAREAGMATAVVGERRWAYERLVCLQLRPVDTVTDR